MIGWASTAYYISNQDWITGRYSLLRTMHTHSQEQCTFTPTNNAQTPLYYRETRSYSVLLRKGPAGNDISITATTARASSVHWSQAISTTLPEILFLSMGNINKESSEKSLRTLGTTWSPCSSRSTLEWRNRLDNTQSTPSHPT